MQSAAQTAGQKPTIATCLRRKRLFSGVSRNRFAPLFIGIALFPLLVIVRRGADRVSMSGELLQLDRLCLPACAPDRIGAFKRSAWRMDLLLTGNFNGRYHSYPGWKSLRVSRSQSAIRNATGYGIENIAWLRAARGTGLRPSEASNYDSIFIIVRRLAFLPLRAVSFPHQHEESVMNEENFNLSLRKFLKMVGVSSQNAIEKAVASALAEQRINGNESLPAKMTLQIPGLQLDISFDGKIELE
jgi:hypothetical protein